MFLGKGQGQARTSTSRSKEYNINVEAVEQFQQQFRSICHLGSGLFEDTKRGWSPIRKKSTAEN